MDLGSLNVQGTLLASLAEGLPTFDLTGTWKSDDGGTYYIRQIGNKVSWLGESDSWSNVAYGSILGDIISLEWMDVPKNGGYDSGMLALRIDSEDRMTALDRTGGFAGSTWSREMFLVPSDPVEVTPIPIPGPVAMQEPLLNPEARSDFSSDLVSVTPIPLP
jgi:hypothetical protein